VPRDVDLLGVTWIFSSVTSRRRLSSPFITLARNSAHNPISHLLSINFSSAHLLVTVISARYFSELFHATPTSAQLLLSVRLFLTSMAPNGHSASGKKRTRNACDEPPASWLDKHGQPEYDAYKHAALGQCLSFDAWKMSHQHTNGLSLYYKTLDILDESDSTVSCPFRLIYMCRLLTTSGRRRSASQGQGSADQGAWSSWPPKEVSFNSW